MSNELTLHESQQLAVQVDVANKYPRQLDSFVDKVFSVVQRDQDFAMSCIYCVPVGKTEGVQKFELGPSVRLSEEMQKYWKHLRVAVNCDLQSDKIVCTGLIMDCESNVAETLTEIVSIVGPQGKWNDRRVQLKVKAMQSCMKRDLRLSIMGKSYANELIEKILEDLLPDAVESWKFCVEEYASIGVKEETILKYFKVKSASDLSKRDIYKAIGIYNYLKEQGEGAEFVFGGEKNSYKPSVRPEDIQEVKPQPQQQKRIVTKPAQSKSVQSSPEVMGAEEFKAEVSSYFRIGYTESDFNEDLSMKGIEGGVDAVPVERQAEVLAMLAKQEQAGA